MEAYERIVDWFEIPVTNIEMAATFYGAIFERPLFPGEVKGLKMYFFGIGGSGINGALVEKNRDGVYLYEPNSKGSIVFFNGGNDLDKVLNKVESNGGKIYVNKTLISAEIGYYALFGDLDGNTIGLHSLR
jgi:uncharacterized protein